MSWETAQLGDLCVIQIGKTPSRSERKYWEGGSHPWVSISDITRNLNIHATKEHITDRAVREAGCKLIEPKTLLMSFKLSIGKLAFAQIPLFTNEAVAALKPKQASELDSKYLFRALEHIDFNDAGNRAAMGRTLNRRSLGEITIPLPPLDEQRRITAILDKADALRRKRKRALELLDGLTQSFFLNAFGDVERGNPRHPIQPLGSITNEIYRYPTYYGIEYEVDGVPEIRGELIKDNGTLVSDRSQLRYISADTAACFPKTRLYAGDLVMSVRGTIGKVGIVPLSLNGANMTANLVRIAPNRKKILPEYLWVALRTERIKRALTGATATTTIATIKAPDLRNLPIIVPQMDDQKRFCDAVAKIEIGTLSAIKHSDQLENVFASLQHRAFSGQL